MATLNKTMENNVPSSQSDLHTIYDVHCHVFNLSHAGLLSFLNRFLHKYWLDFPQLISHPFKVIGRIMRKALLGMGSLVLLAIVLWCAMMWWLIRKNHWVWWICCLFITAVILGIVVKIKYKGCLRRSLNLLSVMENDAFGMFFFMELDLLTILDEMKKGIYRKPAIAKKIKSRDKLESRFRELRSAWENEKQIIVPLKRRVEPAEFIHVQRVVITPLMMDFGFKEFDKIPGIHYSHAPRKPVREQVEDLRNGILLYKSNDGNLLEIRPFIGINPSNYKLKTNSAEKTFPQVLESYFGPEGIKYWDEKNDINYAGIKLYPPLGFDPWPPEDPADSDSNFKKVNCLYRFCQDKQIPITIHCSDGGFITCDEYFEYTDPDKWKSVLMEYPNLKINLAHMGVPAKYGKTIPEWTRIVFDLMVDRPQVYSDFSYRAYKKDFFNRLQEWISQWLKTREEKGKVELMEKLNERILFGSDFSIGLNDSESYYEYWQTFLNSSLAPRLVQLYCQSNPRKFLGF